MPIPDFQSLMLPVLKLASDGLEHRSRDARESLATQFHLTEEERKETLLSGQGRFYNRIIWAVIYLRRAGLLDSGQRGVFRITDRGQAALGQNPQRIDMKFLAQFPEYREWRKGAPPAEKPEVSEQPVLVTTPDELIDAGYTQLREQLIDEVLRQVRASPWQLLERLVVPLLLAMGYGTSEDSGLVLGQAGDGGVDGVIYEDALRLGAIYFQAKRQEATVGRPQLQAFAGSLDGLHVTKGVFITTADFSNEARKYVRDTSKAISLINGRRLAELMVDYEIGVSTAKTLTIKRLDTDYFADPDVL